MSSENYVHGHHESVVRSHARRTLENSAAYLIPYLRPGLRVLDVGCGPGTITADLAERVAPGAVTGIDSSGEVLEGARSLAAERGLSNLEFIEGDAYALPFEDGSVDIVHAHQVLHHVSDPVAVLREMARVTAPGGVVAVREVDYGGSIWYPELPALDDWLRLFRTVHREAGGEPDSGRRLTAWAHEAGLRDVTTTASLWAYISPDERAWWGGSWAERALRSNFATAAIEGGHASQHALDAIADGWKEWAAHPDGWFSFPHAEIIARVET